VIEYSACIQSKDQTLEEMFVKNFTDVNLPALQEQIRKYFILNPYKQSDVDKCPDDDRNSVGNPL
jgi:hypothetical protein